MADVDIKYKGSSIATMNASGTKTLQTSGKYCEGNIEVVYADPEKPAQSKTVTPTASGFTVSPDSGKVLSSVVVNGDADLISANVRKGKNIFGVDGSMEEGITPSGTKDITANGNGIDVTQYATVNVNVPQGAVNTKRFAVTLASDITSYTSKVLVTDSDIAAHYADESFSAVLIFKGGFQNKASIQIATQGNIGRSGAYGSGLRSSSSATAQFIISQPINHTPSSSTTNSVYANSSGQLGWTISSTYPLRAGDYDILVWW